MTDREMVLIARKILKEHKKKYDYMSIPTKNMVYVRYDKEPVAKITMNSESDISIN